MSIDQSELPPIYRLFGAPTKVQCAECHWVGLSSHLFQRCPHGEALLVCPVCESPFARYPQKAEHLWSDPY
jgi:NAD-dependent SIR2 family protein deacetylase